MLPGFSTVFNVDHYDLGATLSSGQAFRWEQEAGLWTGIIGDHWLSLRQVGTSIEAQTGTSVSDWQWLINYLQLEVDIAAVVATFPQDAPMHAATKSCFGLRLLRQDPWECLASFILSSTKQIVQIRQIIKTLCHRFGQQVARPESAAPAFAFPTPKVLAAASEAELRHCKMGFRAPYLRETARAVASGLDLAALANKRVGEARLALMELPGVGRKIADCVLLFAYGFQSAFPVDVWVMKTLYRLYFKGRKVRIARLHAFAETHFGPYAGYAQQYLFHWARTKSDSPLKRTALAAGAA